MPTYAVTGATGPFGRAAVESLLARGVAPSDVVAVVRAPDRATDLADRGVAVRLGDYDRPETLAPALNGVTHLLLVSGNEPGKRLAQHTAVIDAAREAGVARIAYTSIAKADTSANPLAPDHQATEEALRASGLGWVVLRNNWYVENYTPKLDQYAATGEIAGAAGDGRIGGAPRADFAAAAVAALVAGDTGRVYELAGPAFTLAELAATVSEVTGSAVKYRDLSAGEYAGLLESYGLDAGTAAFVAALDSSIARGELDVPATDLEALLGRPATPLADAVRAARQ